MKHTPHDMRPPESPEAAPNDEQLLAEQQIVELPERLAATVINPLVGVPTEAAIASDVLTSGPARAVEAVEETPVDDTAGSL